MSYSDQVRDRILDAAEAEFLKHGYAGASTNRVLLAAGGSKATVFRHFQTKEGMFAVVVERIVTRMMQTFELSAVEGDDPFEALAEFGHAILKGVLAERAVFFMRLVIAEGSRFPEARDTFVRIGIAPMVSWLEQRLARWAANGTIRSADPARDAQHFIGLTSSAWLMWSLLGIGGEVTEDTLKKQVDGAVEIFLQGRLPR